MISEAASGFSFASSVELGRPGTKWDKPPPVPRSKNDGNGCGSTVTNICKLTTFGKRASWKGAHRINACTRRLNALTGKMTSASVCFGVKADRCTKLSVAAADPTLQFRLI
jgi:hypothetical protein